ncbi:hypothetical protein CDAR_42991 [Caerostris darwini]|uniref:Uncharacterized protein n=1 Tax=Caerostris darwini TaxID=1538125 RepID=A0AAV4WHJ5_9ARAC|nr:hypothetical protein CDAR_42991 [Caerostris darwini]
MSEKLDHDRRHIPPRISELSLVIFNLMTRKTRRQWKMQMLPFPKPIKHLKTPGRSKGDANLIMKGVSVTHVSRRRISVTQLLSCRCVHETVSDYVKLSRIL